VSLILDALRRKSSDRDAASPGTLQADTVLATLGYPRRTALRAPPLKSLAISAFGAVALGFIGVPLVLMVMNRSGARREPTRAAPRSSDRPAAPSSRGSSIVPGPPAVAPATPAKRPDGSIAPGGATARSGAAPPTGGTVLAAPLRPRLGLSTASTTGVAEPAANEPSLLTASRQPAASAPAAGPPGAGRSGAVRPLARGAQPGDASEPSPPSAQPAPTADHFGLGLYYQRIGDFSGAMAQYRTLLEQNDASAEVHNNLGLLYQDRREMDEAVRQFQRAITIDPRYVKAHNNLGVADLRLGRLEEATAELRVVLAAEPRNVESMVNLALVQKAAGRVADARELLQRAVAIDPRNAGSHYNLAVVADESGDSATAVEHYRAFLRFGSITHVELVAPVRARLLALGSS
jgi:Tfp pilus assembly protein PilF